MFKEKVNARTDGRTTDTGPWHKLAGLRPVELKMLVTCISHDVLNSFSAIFIILDTLNCPLQMLSIWTSLILINPLPHNAAFWCTTDIQLWKTIVKKGKIACNKQFLYFSRFLPHMAIISQFKCALKCCLQFFFSLDQSKIFSSGNGLKNKATVNLASGNAFKLDTSKTFSIL